MLLLGSVQESAVCQRKRQLDMHTVQVVGVLNFLIPFTAKNSRWVPLQAGDTKTPKKSYFFASDEISLINLYGYHILK